MITLHDSPDSAERFAQRTWRQDSQLAESQLDAPTHKKVNGMIESTIGSHPVAAVAVAMVVGIAVGWWMKRR